MTSHDVQLVARAIKSRVDAFSDRRLNDGDDVWEARELELRCGVAATANAIAVEFARSDTTFNLARFAAACGLYVSEGRDNYSDCRPGELTWEGPRHAHDANSASDKGPFCVKCGVTVEVTADDGCPRCHFDSVVPSVQPDPAQTISDHDLHVRLPAYNGWSATYEYPGFIHYSHPESDVMVCASSDFNGDGKLDIQIQTTDGHSFNDGENAHWPHEGRTAEKMFSRIRPYLDKYHPSVTNAPKES